jgi:hypothetical protein
MRGRRRRWLIVALLSAVFVILLALAVVLLLSSLQQVPIAGGAVTIDLGGGSRFINPLLATTDTDEGLTSLVFAGLTTRNLAGTIVPNLARWRITDGGQRYVFFLRPHLHWQDGQPQSAADIAYTLHLLADPNYPAYSEVWSGIRISTPNSRTVVLDLPNPDFTFLQQTTVGLLPRHPKTAHWPVGSGPYRVARITLSRIVLTLVKRGSIVQPFLRHVTFLLTKGQSARSVLRCREHFGPLRNTSIPVTRLLGLGFNLATLPDILVRRALVAALQAADLGTPTLTPTFPPGHESPAVHKPTISARELMIADGWRLRRGRWTRAHHVLSVRLVAPNAALIAPYVTAVARAWQRAGFVVSTTQLPFAVLLRRVLAPGSFDAAILEWDFGSPDYNPGALWDSTAPLNFMHLHDTIIDRLAAALPATPTFAGRDAIRRRIGQRLAADVAGVSLAPVSYACRIPRSLRGFKRPRFITTTADLLTDEPHWYHRTRLILRNPFNRLYHLFRSLIR